MPDKNSYNHSINIVRFKYEEASASQRNQIKALLVAIWPEQDSQDVHSPFFKLMSFCAYSGECLVGYAAVLSWPLRVGHTVFNVYGLSCVCTHPEYQNKGICRNSITEATRWIIESKLFDFGLFTCTKSLTRFYEQTGIWKKDASLHAEDFSPALHNGLYRKLYLLPLEQFLFDFRDCSDGAFKAGKLAFLHESLVSLSSVRVRKYSNFSS